MKKLPDITSACGKTPLVYLDKASQALGANIYGKLEYFNPLSSVKDRIGLAMIQDGLDIPAIPGLPWHLYAGSKDCSWF